MLRVFAKRLGILLFTMVVVWFLVFTVNEFSPGQVARKVLGPFATRCPRKLGPICDTTPPPEHVIGSRHRILCHIPLKELRTIEPIISVAAQ